MEELLDFIRRNPRVRLRPTCPVGPGSLSLDLSSLAQVQDGILELRDQVMNTLHLRLPLNGITALHCSPGEVACTLPGEARLTLAAVSDPLAEERCREVVGAFEAELGGPWGILTPYERETIREWLSAWPPELVREALRRAVQAGARNLRYMDRILVSWSKHQVRSLEDVRNLDEQFAARGGNSHRRKALRRERVPSQAAYRPSEVDWEHEPPL